MKTTRAFGWVMAVAFLSLAASPASAQYTIDTLSAWGGAVNGFQRVGNIGYCAAGKRLVIVDMTNESNIHELGSVTLAGVASAVAVRGNYAYVGGYFAVGNSFGALVVVDVSNSASPSVVWQGAGVYAGIPFRAQFYGNYLFLNGANYPVVYDITSPASPAVTPGDSGSHKTTFGAGFHAQDIAIAGNLIYVACLSPAKVAIFNLQPDPLHPGLAPVGQVTAASGPSLVQRIAVDGTTAIVQVYDFSQPDGNQHVVKLVDVSNPASPTLRSTYTDVMQADGVAIQGHVAFVADWCTSGLDPGNGNLARLKGLAIFDITDSGNPVLIGTYNTAHSAIRDVQVVGNRAYLLCDGQGLEVLDVSDPTNPTRVGGYFSPAKMQHVTRVGNLLYIADQWNGFSIVDVSNPATPHLLGVFRTPSDIAHQQSTHVEVTGNTAYLAAGYGGIDVVDVSDPAAPALVLHYAGTFGAPNMMCSALEVYGGVLHCTSLWMEPNLFGACATIGYNNYDLSSMTTSPIVVGQDCQSAPHRLTTKDGMTFGSYGNVFTREDNRDAQHPVQPDSGSTVFNGGDLEISGNYLFATSASTNTNAPYQGGFYIYDITDVVQPPIQVGLMLNGAWTDNTNNHANAVGVSGARAFIGADDQLVAIDVSSPTTPLVLATSVGTGATDVVATGNLIYSTNLGSNGLVVGESVECTGLLIRRLRCKADYDGNGTIAVADIFAFLNGWFAGDPQADFDGANGIQVADIFAFLNAWFAGCP